MGYDIDIEHPPENEETAYQGASTYLAPAPGPALQNCGLMADELRDYGLDVGDVRTVVRTFRAAAQVAVDAPAAHPSGIFGSPAPGADRPIARLHSGLGGT